MDTRRWSRWSKGLGIFIPCQLLPSLLPWWRSQRARQQLQQPFDCQSEMATSWELGGLQHQFRQRQRPEEEKKSVIGVHQSKIMGLVLISL